MGLGLGSGKIKSQKSEIKIDNSIVLSPIVLIPSSCLLFTVYCLLAMLLAIDLGLHTGYALYGIDGRLRSYRSQHFGALNVLKRAAYTILGTTPDVTHLVMEGGGAVAHVWEQVAQRKNIAVEIIGAERWRQRLLYDREQRSGEIAKATADELARRVIAWSGALKPTSLRHDAAEAIMIGLWGVLEYGWLPAVPPEVRR